MSKKKRPPLFGSATAAPTNAPWVSGSTATGPQPRMASALSNHAAKPMTIGAAAEYYSRLQRDSQRLDVRLGAILWLHQVIGLVVVNVLMDDLQAQKRKVFLVVWSALWLGRSFITKQLASLTTTRNSIDNLIRCRIVALGVFSYIAVAAHGRPLSWKAASKLAPLFMIDAISIRRIRNPDLLLFPEVVDLVEMACIVSAFSTQYNELSLVIYDRVAVVFVTATLAIHYCVVEGVRHALFKLPWTSAAQTRQNQLRRFQAVEAVARAAAQDDHEIPFVAFAKKEHTDTSSHGACDESAASHGSLEMVSRWLAVQALTVVLQIVATALLLHSWELCSIVMCASVHLLVEISLIHSALAHPHPLFASAHEILEARSAHTS